MTLADRHPLPPHPRYWIRRRPTYRDDIVTPSIVHLADQHGRPTCHEARALLAVPWLEVADLDRDTVEQITAALPDVALHRRCWAPDTDGDDHMAAELARRDDLAGMNLAEQMNFAERMADAGLLPEHYRRQPANVLLAMQYGSALQVPTMTAILGVHVIEGRQVPSAHLVGALIRRAGHRLRVGYDPSREVGWATIRRADDPDHEYRAEWTVARADAAGLVQPRPGKGPTNWQKHPVAMCKRRAVYEVGNDACPEVLLGIDLSAAGPTLDDLPVADEQPADHPVKDAEEMNDVVDAVLVDEPPQQQGDEFDQLTHAGLRTRLNVERQRLGLEWSDLEADYAETYEGRMLRDADEHELRAFTRTVAGRVRQ